MTLVAAALCAQDRPLASLPYTPSLEPTFIDRSVDPCVDFWRYSCGNWNKLNPIPPDQARWSVYGKMAQENLHRPAFPGGVSHQRRGREHAGIRQGILVQGWTIHGAAASLPGLVVAQVKILLPSGATPTPIGAPTVREGFAGVRQPLPYGRGSDWVFTMVAGERPSLR